MTIVIAGGGIAGLTLAGFLERTEHNVIIVERAPQFAPVGYVVGIWSNGVQVLKELNLFEDFKEKTFLAESQQTFSAKGKLLRKLDFTRLNAKFDGAVRFIHRADLHSILLKKISKTKVITGTTINSYTENNGVLTLELSNGETITCDWLIGADGINSSVRALMFPGIDMVKKHAMRFYSFIHIVEGGHGLEGNKEFLGVGKMLGIYPHSKTQCGIYASVSNPQRLTGTNAQQVKQEFAGFDKNVSDIIGKIDESTDVFSNIITEVSSPVWHKGNVVLIGDAAHAMLPTTGQGVSAAMEDAMVLYSMLFKQDVEAQKTTALLQQFQANRTKKLNPIRVSSVRNNFVLMNNNALVCMLRDLFIKFLPSPEKKLERFFMHE